MRASCHCTLIYNERSKVVVAPRGSMPKGSSIWTPISSTPSRRKAMRTAAGTMTQWQALQRVKGRKASQMTRNLDVCLRHRHTHVLTCSLGSGDWTLYTVATAWQKNLMLVLFWGTGVLFGVSSAG